MIPRRAFTLVELLVVIAVVAILAAILFPVFAQAKAAAKATACLSNMRQLGTGFAMYQGDADDALPLSGEPTGEGAGTWIPAGHLPSMPACANRFGPLDLCTVSDVSRGALFPYVRSRGVYRCSAEQTGRYKHNGARVDSQKQWVTYGMNYHVSGWPMGSIAFPAATALLVDEDVTTRNNGSFVPCWTASGPADAPTCAYPADEFGLQHASGANILYTDGHAQRRSRKAFTPGSAAHRIWFPGRAAS